MRTCSRLESQMKLGVTLMLLTGLVLVPHLVQLGACKQRVAKLRDTEGWPTGDTGIKA